MKKGLLKRGINKVFSNIERYFYRNDFSLLKTLYINFRSLPFKQAIKLPIYIYGNVKLDSLYGDIEILGEIKRGMIRIGLPMKGAIIDTRIAHFLNNGKIVFKGKVDFSNGATINNRGGNLIFENNVLIGENVRIICLYHIEIKEGARIAHESQIIDTNFHFILDNSTLMAHSPKGHIIIGKYCWVGNRTSVQKGTVLPDYTIVGSNSLLNKNYKDIPPYSLIGGMPAKFIKGGIRRVFNIHNERMLKKYFKEHGNDATFIYNGEDINKFCETI